MRSYLLRTSADINSDPADIGPDLIEGWENNDASITITAGSLSYTIPGPDFSNKYTR